MGSIEKKGLQQDLLQRQHQHHRLITKLFGAVYLGPFGHFLHLLLDKIFKGKKDSKTVAKKFWPVLGLDKSPVCATPSPCRLPQLGRFWLVQAISLLSFFLYNIHVVFWFLISYPDSLTNWLAFSGEFS
ncbi:hypothetical protein GBA52_012880 [Prunus armeniaca]|nr:hypothetical protein GBA52_012880 [Prunus armeniaca]